MPQDREAFLDTLRTVIDPAELRWLWLTHPDRDHTGSLQALMESVPHLELVTTFLGYGMLSLLQPVPLERLYLLNPGESLDLGDRRITALKPPTFDNPATTGFFDDKSGALLSADCFGALLEKPADTADDLPTEELRAGQTLWATLDAPWLHNVDRTKFAHELDGVRRMEPALVLSAHLPPARSCTEALLANWRMYRTPNRWSDPTKQPCRRCWQTRRKTPPRPARAHSRAARRRFVSIAAAFRLRRAAARTIPRKRRRNAVPGALTDLRWRN